MIEEAGVRVTRRDTQALKDNSPESLKRAVQRWVDGLLAKLTGKPGVFSTRIVYAHRLKRGGPKEIQLVNLDGLHQRSITQNNNINVLPSWAPGGKIAYTSYLAHNPDLYISGRKVSARAAAPPWTRLG